VHTIPRRRALAALSGLAVAAATLTGGAATAAAAAGVLTPAIAANPHHVVAGKVSLTDPKATTFSCQTTTPATCYGPAQIRAAYGVDKLSSQFKVDGTGRTIVIVDAFQSPTITSDLAAFDSLFGLSAPKFNIIAPDGLTPFDPTNADEVNWAGEITLDVEWAHAIAPGATIDLVLSKSDQDADIYSAQKYVVDHNLGDVLSQSFGEAEQCMDPTIFAQSHTLFQKAAQEKMTVFASSGDQGASQPTCDGATHFKAVSTPASDPQVTGVGGTILTADGTTGAYQGETAWNEPDYAAAGGGGYSVDYATPAFQKSLKLPKRGVPDISYNAAINQGVLAVWSSSGQGAGLVFRFGGTSAGSPQWAGLAALGDQLGRHRMGNVNDELYLFAHQPLYGQLFHDVTTGDNTYHGEVTVDGYAATKGWDPATGLGTPKSQTLIPLLAATAW
jgi:subtilase family serine protease